MRKSWTYYKYYFMGANTIFGHFFPFLLIMVLNVLIVKILKENQQNMQGLIQDEYTVCDLPKFCINNQAISCFSDLIGILEEF